MGLCVKQAQRRSPGAAEHVPTVDFEMGAQRFDVGHQIVRRVAADLAQRTRPAGTALVEDDDPIMLRVKKASVQRRCAGARPTMEENHRRALRVAAFLEIERVKRIDSERSGSIGFKRGKKRVAGHGTGSSDSVKESTYDQARTVSTCCADAKMRRPFLITVVGRFCPAVGLSASAGAVNDGPDPAHKPGARGNRPCR